MLVQESPFLSNMVTIYVATSTIVMLNTKFQIDLNIFFKKTFILKTGALCFRLQVTLPMGFKDRLDSCSPLQVTISIPISPFQIIVQCLGTSTTVFLRHKRV